MTVPKDELQAQWSFFSFSSLLHIHVSAHTADVTPRLRADTPEVRRGHRLLSRRQVVGVSDAVLRYLCMALTGYSYTAALKTVLDYIRILICFALVFPRVSLQTVIFCTDDCGDWRICSKSNVMPQFAYVLSRYRQSIGRATADDQVQQTVILRTSCA
jgi:hypothetical protein